VFEPHELNDNGKLLELLKNAADAENNDTKFASLSQIIETQSNMNVQKYCIYKILQQ